MIINLLGDSSVEPVDEITESDCVSSMLTECSFFHDSLATNRDVLGPLVIKAS